MGPGSTVFAASGKCGARFKLLCRSDEVHVSFKALVTFTVSISITSVVLVHRPGLRLVVGWLVPVPET